MKNKNLKHFFKQNYQKIILLFLLIFFYVILYKIYMPRVNAFGCFDDCNNFMGGYFLLQGKKLFSEIFFNHNPLMAYVSLIIQFFTNPQNLYELILRHRQALLLFSFTFNFILILRFGIPAFAFAIFYELTKFYLFGDRFLAEGFIVYPLIYLVGLAWYKIQEKEISLFDYLFTGIFTWFIVFMREPYVPISLLLFIFILWNKKILIHKKWIKNNKNIILSFGIFLTLSISTLFYHDTKEFYYNVVSLNKGLVSMESDSINLKIFFYPILLFFGGEWGYFRYLVLSLNVLFLISFIIILLRRQWKLIVSIFVILGLLNIRYVVPGKTFYESFHMLCWYGIFIFISFLMLTFVYKINKKIFSFVVFLYIGILIYHIFSPQSFLRNKADPHYELITNYGGPMQVGNVVSVLSTPEDSLFLDGFDDIIYWQAKRFSDYKYSWYTSLMPSQDKYIKARMDMFKNHPPDFYYGSCPKEERKYYLLPDFIIRDYIRLYADEKPSCLWVKKTKLASISSEQWEKANSSLYYLPNKN